MTKELTAREYLFALHEHFNGDWDQTLKAIQNKTNIRPEQVTQEACDYITVVDTEYPKRVFTTSYKPPFVIRYRGDITLLSEAKKHMAIVASRHSSLSRIDKVEKDLDELPEDFVFVITNSQVTADLEKHKHILVKPAGLNELVPGITKTFEAGLIKSGGLIISLWPDNRPAEQFLFADSRLFVGALCESILVVELCNQGSGLLTVMTGLNFETLIMVYPTEAQAEGLMNNQLIKEGANLVENAQDIIDLLLK